MLDILIRLVTHPSDRAHGAHGNDLVAVNLVAGDLRRVHQHGEWSGLARYDTDGEGADCTTHHTAVDGEAGELESHGRVGVHPGTLVLQPVGLQRRSRLFRSSRRRSDQVRYPHTADGAGGE